MTQTTSDCLSVERAAHGAAARRVALRVVVLLTSTMLAGLPVQAQTINNQLRGTSAQGAAGNPAVIFGSSSSAPLSGQLQPGQIIQGQPGQPGRANSAGQVPGQNPLLPPNPAQPGPLAQDALNQITPADPFTERDLEEELEARRTPNSRVGPTQVSLAEEDDEEEDPFGDPLPRPSEPLTEAELEQEERELLERARAIEPTGPVQAGAEIDEEENPYEAVGFRVGTFELRPTLEIGIAGTSLKAFQTTDDDPSQLVSSDEDGVFGQLEFGLTAESDWVRHSLAIDASARFQEGIRGDAEAQPELNISAAGELDITQQTTLSGELSYTYLLEESRSGFIDTGNAEQIAAAGTPSQQTIEGLLSLGHDNGFLFGDVSSSLTRTILGSVELNDGSEVRQADNDNSLYTVGLRGGFRASPVFRPFLEGQLGWRVNDADDAETGASRDSMLYTLRMGTELDFGDKLGGEISVGYVAEDFKNPALQTLGGISLAAELEWSPRQRTSVGLQLETSTQPSGIEGSSGAIVYNGDVSITQQIRRNLTATLNAGLEFEDFDRVQSDVTTANAELGFTYWLNRGVGLVGTYSHERAFSADESQRQTTNGVFLGLRLQR